MGDNRTIYEKHGVEILTTECHLKEVRPLVPNMESAETDVSLLIQWIENGTYDTDRFNELPHLRRDGDTRNIILFDKERHEYVVINGGRHRHFEKNGKSLISQPVSPRTFVEQVKKNIASVNILQSGEKVMYQDSSPLGGYWPESLRQKVEMTQRIAYHNLRAQLSGVDSVLVVPLYTAALSYNTNEDEQTYAAATYRIPMKKKDTPFYYDGDTDASESELMPYLELINSGSRLVALTGNYMADGALVALGYAHPQNHIGNRYLEVIFNSEGKPVEYAGVLTDMEDVVHIHHYSRRDTYTEAQVAGGSTNDFLISPYGKAVLHMLYKALHGDIDYYVHQVLNNSYFDEKSVKQTLLWEILNPAQRGFLLGYKLATGEVVRELVSEMDTEESLEKRTVGLMMGNIPVNLNDELRRLITRMRDYQNFKGFGVRGALLRPKVEEEIEILTAVIAAMVAKDTVRQMAPWLIGYDPFEPYSQAASRINTTMNTVVSDEDSQPKKKKRRRRH